MTISKRLSTFAVIAAIASMIMIPPFTSTNSPAEAVHFSHTVLPEEIPNPENTIGDLQIRVVFHFQQSTEIIDSFAIFNQIGGYDYNELPKLQLIGGVGPDKLFLYHVTDNAHHNKHTDRLPEYTDFDVDVFIMKGSEAYRKMAYTTCSVLDYNVVTLFDLEETFSKPELKFVVADDYIIECGSFHPHCPICITIKEEAQKQGFTDVSQFGADSEYANWQEFWEKNKQQSP